MKFLGEWVRGVSAGGCGQGNQALYWTNPQFLVTLVDPDPTDEDDRCTLIVSLMQKYTRENRMKKPNLESLEEYIQFSLFRIIDKADAEKAKRTGQKLYASQLERCGTNEAYINRREVTRRFREPPGDYLLIPSCYDSGREAHFLLRVFTEKSIEENNASVLIENKKNLADTDIFFQNVNFESEFGNWCNLVGSVKPSIPQNSSSCASDIKPRQYIKRRAVICVRSTPQGENQRNDEEVAYFRGSARANLKPHEIVQVDESCVLM